MKITVKLYGGLKSCGNRREMGLVFKKKKVTVSEVIKRLKYTPEESKYLSIAVNDKVKNQNTVLKEKDILILSLPVGGG